MQPSFPFRCPHSSQVHRRACLRCQGTGYRWPAGMAEAVGLALLDGGPWGVATLEARARDMRCKEPGDVDPAEYAAVLELLAGLTEALRCT